MSATGPLGILTGISYVSGLDYFKGINEKAMAEMSPGKMMVPNPPIVMVSVNCDYYAHCLTKGLLDAVAEHLMEGIDRVVAAGCNMLVIASNTGHIVYPDVVDKYPHLCVIHIADCCAFSIKSLGSITQVGLIGTKPTMELDYLKIRLAAHGLSTVVPSDQSARDEIFRIIAEELSYNNFIGSSRVTMVAEIEALRDSGVRACILGCTEIELLLEGVSIDGITLIRSAEEHISATALVLAGKLAPAELLPPVHLS